MKLFYFIFIFLTLALPLMFFLGFLAGEVPVVALLMAFGVSFVFSFCCKMLKRMTYAPKYFDTNFNKYYSLEASLLGVQTEIEEALSSIKALQILPKRIVNSKNSNTAYELNLVMDSDKRHTVLAHASYEDIKNDAQTLSMHLGLQIVEKE